MFLLIVSILTFVSSVCAQYRFDCYENYCSTKGNECPEFSCEGGRTVYNATQCGCCSLCIKNLNEGEECLTTYYGWRADIAECGPGLVCKSSPGTKGKCVPSKCLKRKRDYEKVYSSDAAPLLQPAFECDHFGNFEPSEDSNGKSHVVCINDVMCFCVDKNGMRIFGTDFARDNVSLSNMDCDCSRDINDFPKATDAENLPRCLPNGDYDPLQCVQNECFCMDSPSFDKVDASDMKKLPCYSEDRHKNNRSTTCFERRKEETERSKKKNLIEIGADHTECELDGSYSPLQCKKGRCFCVKKNGEVHFGYGNVKQKEGKLICRCLRDQELIQSYTNKKTIRMKIFEEIKCEVNYVSNKTIIIESFFSDFMKY